MEKCPEKLRKWVLYLEVWVQSVIFLSFLQPKNRQADDRKDCCEAECGSQILPKSVSDDTRKIGPRKATDISCYGKDSKHWNTAKRDVCRRVGHPALRLRRSLRPSDRTWRNRIYRGSSSAHINIENAPLRPVEWAFFHSLSIDTG